MTQQNTMPDVMYIEAGALNWDASVIAGGTKYIRADLHTDLLKHARYYLDGVARDAYDNRLVCEIIHNIDKVLGEQNVT